MEGSSVKTNVDISQFTQSVPLLLVNVAGLVFGETMQEYQPAALPMGNDLPISAALAFTSTSDPLLDKEPAQTGIYQPAFDLPGSFRECPVGDAADWGNSAKARIFTADKVRR